MTENEGKVLSGLLSMQTLLHAAPDIKWMAEVLTRALLVVPGVCSAALYYEDSLLASEGSCDDSFSWPSAADGTIPDFPHTTVQILTLETSIRTMGHVLVAVEEENLYHDYLPYIENSLNIASLIIENNLQEKQLYEMNSHLEAKVSEQVEQIRKKNRELEQVLHVASHDLRSPLVNINGHGKELENTLRSLLESLEQGLQVGDQESTSLKDEIFYALDIIRESTLRMDLLLSGLLALSRIGRLALTLEDLDMNSLIGKVLQSRDFGIKNADISLSVGRLPSCRGDDVQVSQVFANLLDNAIKYLDPQRPGVIAITGEAKGLFSIYSVADNGIGIDPAHKHNIFEVFHRLDPKRGNGEGLGLNIVQQSLASMGGDVWVESEVSKGSRFHVKLPSV